jgi:hypothetical protein
MENVESKKQSQALLDKGVIKPRTSPWRSPIGLYMAYVGTFQSLEQDYICDC